MGLETFQVEERSDPAELLLLPPPSFCRSPAPGISNRETSCAQPWEAPQGYLLLLGTYPLPKHCWSLLSASNITHCWLHPLMETVVAEKTMQVPALLPPGRPQCAASSSSPGGWTFLQPSMCLIPSSPGQGVTCWMSVRAYRSDSYNLGLWLQEEPWQIHTPLALTQRVSNTRLY